VVQDTGGGIPPAVLPHIFEPFFSTKERARGTGLGLASVYGIVTQLGGTITASSEAGRGAAFTIVLPQAGNGSAPDSTPGSEPPPPGRCADGNSAPNHPDSDFAARK
jgi:K+-sensing histidine kinase KdpD